MLSQETDCLPCTDVFAEPTCLQQAQGQCASCISTDKCPHTFHKHYASALQQQSVCKTVQVPAEMGLQRRTEGNGTQEEQVHIPWTSWVELAWPGRSCSPWGLRGLRETESGVDILQTGIAYTTASDVNWLHTKLLLCYSAQTHHKGSPACSQQQACCGWSTTRRPQVERVRLYKPGQSSSGTKGWGKKGALGVSTALAHHDRSCALQGGSHHEGHPQGHTCWGPLALPSD